MYNCVWYFCIYLDGLSPNEWHALFCITNNRHDVTITKHAIKRHFLIWMTTARQPTKGQCSCVLTLKYTFICVYWCTRQRIHNTLIVVDRYLQLMGNKMQVSVYHIKVYWILIIFNMGIPILVRQHLCIETAPRSLVPMAMFDLFVHIAQYFTCHDRLLQCEDTVITQLLIFYMSIFIRYLLRFTLLWIRVLFN